MKKLTLLMSVLMVAFSSVLAESRLSVSPSYWAFPNQSYYEGETDVQLQGQYDFALDTAELAGELTWQVKGGLDGATFSVAALPEAESAALRVSYIATKAGKYKDSIFVSAGELKDTMVVTLKVTENPRPVITAEALEWGEMEIAEAKAGVAKNLVATVSEGALSEVKTNNAAFIAELKDGQAVITFKSNKPGSYNAKATLSAPHAVDVDVNLSAEVKTPAPEVIVKPTEWKTEIVMDGPTVEAEKYISITGKWLVSDVNVEVEGGAESPFQWIDAEQKVTFSASKGGTYNDALIISADDVAPQRVELSIKVIKPVIKIGAAELNFGEMSLADAVEGKQTQETTVSVQPEAEMTVELSGDNAAAFKAEIKDGKIIVAFKASAAGAYNAIATVKSAGAEPKNLMLSASVAMPKPELNVTPTEWKETISLSNGKAQAERQISINAVFTYSYPIVALQNGTNFTWDAANSKVTFSADKVGEYKDTLVVSAVGADDVKVALEITVKEEEIPVGPVAVTGVTLNQTSAEIEVGKTLTLVATVMPADADNKNVTWESSNATVATVANGVVTAVAVGAATITVKTVDGNYTATCVITVKDGGVTPPPTPAGGWVSDPSTLKAGDKIIITNMAHDKAMSTSQTAVENKSYYRGETAFDESNISSEVEQVELVASGSNFKLKVTGGYLYFDDEWMTANKGKKQNWLGTNETGSEFNFEKSGDTIFVVEVKNDGLILHNAQYTRFSHYARTSAVRQEGGLAIYLIGGEQPAIIPTTTIAIEPTSATIEVGQSVTLKVTRDGNDELVWASSDAAVATVENGVVKGIKEGTATITATANGKSASCELTVKAGEVPPTPPTPSGDWVSDPSTLKAGDKIIITNKTGLIAMSTSQTAEENKTYYRGETAFDESNISSEVEQVELVASGSNFKLKVTGGYLYFDDAWMTAGKDGKKANWLGTNETGSEFKFEANGEYISIVEVKNDGLILYNANNTRFSHYAKTSSLENAETKIFLLGEVEQKATTTLTIDPKTAEVAVGGTVTLKVQRDGNDELVWKSMDENIATVANGVVTGVAEGVVKIAATANNISDTCVVTVVKSSDIQTKTIAEFIAAKGGKCYLTGVVSNIKKYDDGSYNKYGNFDLTDASGKIYIYGLLTADGEKQQFPSLGVDEGDTLTVIAENYQLYKETDEVVDAIFVSVKKAGATPMPDVTVLDMDYAEAAYYEEEGGAIWMVYAGKYPADETQLDLDYPQLALYFDARSKTHLAGLYELYPGCTLYTSDNDSIEFVSGYVKIVCLEGETADAQGYYQFTATLYDEQDNIYIYQFESEVYAYDYLTDEDFALEDKTGDEAIENVEFKVDFDAPMYNIQGMQVGPNASGILIQNGHKFIIVK